MNLGSRFEFQIFLSWGRGKSKRSRWCCESQFPVASENRAGCTGGTVEILGIYWTLPKLSPLPQYVVLSGNCELFIKRPRVIVGRECSRTPMKKYTCTTDQPLEQWALSRAGPTEGTLKGKWCCEGSQPIVYFWVNLALDNSSCFSWSMILNNGENRTIGPVCVYFVHSWRRFDHKN